MISTSFRGRSLVVLGVAFVAGLVALPAQDVPTKGTQYAFLVSCAKYQYGLTELPHTIKEMKEFREVLVKTGFDRANIKLLADGEEPRYLPEKDKILKELELFLRRVGPEDTVILVLNGHGVHFEGDKTSYFCPLNAKLSDKKTLVALEGLGGIFPQVEACPAARKLLLVNACRNDPSLELPELALAVTKVRLDKKTKPPVPKGIAALFSCQPSEKSWYYNTAKAEFKDRERSFFFHHLIEAWSGTYSLEEGKKKVTLEDLFRQVSAKTSADADNLIGEPQVPDVRRKYDGEWVINPTPFGGGSPERLEVPLRNGGRLVLEFARIPGGKFLMGSPKQERDDVIKQYNLGSTVLDNEPEHEVELTRDYMVGKTTITVGQFRAFVEDENPNYKTEGERDNKGGYGWTGSGWEQKPEFTWKNPGFRQTDDHPVVLVSYNDAQAFCAWVKRKTGKDVRLPNEAEWERACRGGQRKGRYYFGDAEADLHQYANVADASFRAATKKNWGIQKDDNYAFTSPVKSFPPNPYGLYDMHGNVWQWCQDGYDKDFYTSGNNKDPFCNNNTLRVLRGGSWDGSARLCRAASRLRYEPAFRNGSVGFRLAFRLD